MTLHEFCRRHDVSKQEHEALAWYLCFLRMRAMFYREFGLGFWKGRK